MHEKIDKKTDRPKMTLEKAKIGWNTYWRKIRLLEGCKNGKPEA